MMRGQCGDVLFLSVRDFYDVIYEFFQIVDVEGKCYFGFFGKGIINGRGFVDVYFHVFPDLKKPFEEISSVFGYNGYCELC